MVSSSAQEIYNLTLVNADTEYSQALSPFCISFIIKARQATAAIKLSFVSGQSGTVYITIPAGSSYELPASVSTKAGILTLYMQSPVAGTVVEILEHR